MSDAAPTDDAAVLAAARAAALDAPAVPLSAAGTVPSSVSDWAYAEDLLTVEGGYRQWRLHRLQVVNWGSFHGYTAIDLAGSDVMLCGSSGSGKSTLADAYSNMLNPQAPFNEASNAGLRGRARGEERRNEASYLRGLLGVDESLGHKGGRYLRPPETWIWGGQAATFYDGLEHLTLIRAFFVPALKTRSSDVRPVFAIAPRAVDLREVAPQFSAAGISSGIRRALPDIVFYDTQGEYCEEMETRLHLGAARPLLARIQAGKTFNDVDTLFKNTVLEVPSTYEKADIGIKGFSDLSAVYEDIRETVRQRAVLKGLDDYAGRYRASLHALAVLDELGDPTAPDGPVSLGLSEHLHALLGDWEAPLRQAAEVAGRVHREASDVAEVARRRRHDLERALDQTDDGRLAALQAEDLRLDAALTAARHNRTVLAGHLAPLGRVPDDATEFAALAARAEAALASARKDREPLVEATEEAGGRLYALLHERDQLTRRREFAAGRDDLVPEALDSSRNAMARAAGIAPDQLPFVAQLLDVTEGQGRWRRALELAHGALARTLVVDSRHLQAFRRAVDHLRDPAFAKRRLTFVGVPVDLPIVAPQSEHHLSGKVTYREGSPFTGWLSRQLSDKDFRCVETAAELEGNEPRVTLAGQTSSRERGAHGGFDAAPIIGFSNEALLTDLDRQLRTLTSALERLERTRREADARLQAYDAEVGAARALQAYATFDLLDVDGPARRRIELAQAVERLSEGDDPLAQLRRQVKVASEEEKRLSTEAAKAELTAQYARKRWEDAVSDSDDYGDHVSRLESAGVRLSDEGRALITLAVPAPSGPDPGQLGTMRRTAIQTLSAERRAEIERSDDMTRRIEQMFAAYNATWDDRQRGSGITSLPDFERLHTTLTGSGLAERVDAFAGQMNTWAGEDLILLNNALDSELASIDARLTPINQVLARFPFGDQGHVMQLVLQRVPDDDFTAWRARLRKVIGHATGTNDLKGLQARYLEIREVIAPLRHPRDGGSDAQRDRYLDIKRRIRIIADEYDGAERVGSIANLSTFSGGESQELSAVIQVAALRYALGDSTRPVPRFGAIMMDEAFIKADREFTQRSMTTLQNLGFQTVVAGPLQSMPAVQDFVTTFAFIDKDRVSRVSGVVTATAEDVRAGRPRRRSGERPRSEPPTDPGADEESHPEDPPTP